MVTIRFFQCTIYALPIFLSREAWGVDLWNSKERGRELCIVHCE